MLGTPTHSVLDPLLLLGSMGSSRAFNESISVAALWTMPMSDGMQAAEQRHAPHAMLSHALIQTLPGGCLTHSAACCHWSGTGKSTALMPLMVYSCVTYAATIHRGLP